MKPIASLFLSILLCTFSSCSTQQVSQQSTNEQPPKRFNDFTVNHGLSRQITSIAKELGLTDYRYCGEEDGWETMSLAIIYEKNNETFFAGVTPSNFIYPASVYKMYVAAEVLKQAEQDMFELQDTLTVAWPNVVDKVSELSSDPRPLLQEGDQEPIGYILDLMITRSDNTAANCMIDLVGREAINKTMHEYGWYGSEVTRKFLGSTNEDEAYKNSRGTETNAKHAAEFLYLIQKGELISPWVSEKLSFLLSEQLDHSKLAQAYPEPIQFSHKTGWWSHWTNDVGIVEWDNQYYVIALFLPIEEELALPKFKEFGEKVHQLMQQELSN